MLKRFAILAALIPALASAAVAHGITTKAKQDLLDGAFGTGDTYYAAMLGAAATAGAATTTWAGISGSILAGSGTCTGYSNTNGFSLAGRASTTSGTTGIVGWTTPLTAGASCTIANAAALVIYKAAADVLSIHCLDGTTGTCPAYLSCTAGTCTVNISATATVTITKNEAGEERETYSALDFKVTGVFAESHHELAALSAYEMPSAGSSLWKFGS